LRDRRTLEPWSTSGGYASYMQANEPIEHVRAAFGPESFERLQALKARYDPDNVLHRNQNIPPSAPYASDGDPRPSDPPTSWRGPSG
jgi:hypothetical protein